MEHSWLVFKMMFLWSKSIGSLHENVIILQNSMICSHTGVSMLAHCTRSACFCEYILMHVHLHHWDTCTIYACMCFCPCMCAHVFARTHARMLRVCACMKCVCACDKKRKRETRRGKRSKIAPKSTQCTYACNAYAYVQSYNIGRSRVCHVWNDTMLKEGGQQLHTLKLMHTHTVCKQTGCSQAYRVRDDPMWERRGSSYIHRSTYKRERKRERKSERESYIYACTHTNMQTAAKRVVSVTIQCEGGKRATIESNCGSNLLDLLVAFEDRVGQRLCTGCAGIYYVCEYICICYACMYVFMYVCGFVGMRILCLYIYIYIYIYCMYCLRFVHGRIHIYMHACPFFMSFVKSFLTSSYLLFLSMYVCVYVCMCLCSFWFCGCAICILRT